MANIDKKINDGVLEENVSKKSGIPHDESLTEKDKEKSFKEGLANNSDTEKDMSQQK